MATVLNELNGALRQALAGDPRVVLIGEDILSPYGGAFKVTRDLSDDYPEQVITSPISEAGLAGIAAGMALRGLRPVVEIMFGDFLTLTADQITNHIAKFRWMYNDQVRVPLVIRTPMGGRRGYGPTHSQTLEKMFLGVPGLHVVAPCALASADGSAGPGKTLLAAVADDDPVLFIENKLLYLAAVQSPDTLPEFDLTAVFNATVSGEGYPTFKLALKGAPPPQITIAAYGYMAELARAAALELAYESEIFCEIIVPTQLAPFAPALAPIQSSAAASTRLLTVEEGNLSLGWGAEIVSRVAGGLGTRLTAVQRVGADDTPVPASGVLEVDALPGVSTIIQAVRQMV